MQLQPIGAVEGRIVIAQVHAYLRRHILDGTILPGTILSQVQLAQQLGVSRTPLREALRLLQEERLVVAEHNRRVRVAGVNLGELEALYASRIMLEPLALALSIPHLTEADLDNLACLLDQMSVASRQGDGDSWEEGNKQFHRLFSSHAEERIRETIKRSIDAGERYRRIMARTVPRVWQVAEAEHLAIFTACRERNQEAAVAHLARHLARTALTVIAQIAPEYEPTTVRTALRLITGRISTPSTEPEFTGQIP